MSFENESLQPIKLNFTGDEDEAAIHEEADNVQSLSEFPSLKDLETSNLFSNRFHGEFAHKMALKSLNDDGVHQMNRLL